MPKKCPTGFVCTDWSTVWLAIIVLVMAAAGLYGMHAGRQVSHVSQNQNQNQNQIPAPNIIVVQPREERPSEPTQRYGLALPSLASRGPVAPYQQVGIMAGEGGSSSSAAPDRTILPLYGRELDSRRGKWNYFTRTDGANPVQVPVRYRNRVCDDDVNGCDEIYSDESIHVPALGRAFKATVYRKSLF